MSEVVEVLVAKYGYVMRTKDLKEELKISDTRTLTKKIEDKIIKKGGGYSTLSVAKYLSDLEG